jgi:putative transposase
LLNGVAVTQPNQVWASDITHIRLQKSFYYLCVVMDWFSRHSITWEVSTNIEALFCLDALDRALATGRTPEIFNTDQGVNGEGSLYCA